jgi:hypothetical protein
LDKYTVKIYPKAIRDLDEVYKYIALDKLSPENAKIRLIVLKKLSYPLIHFLKCIRTD